MSLELSIKREKSFDNLDVMRLGQECELENPDTLENPDNTNVFANEVMLKIFSELSYRDILPCQRISRRWNAFSKDKTLNNPKIAFGQKEWKKYFNLEVDEPKLPLKFRQFLNEPCPFSKEETRIKDSHLLVLNPGTGFFSIKPEDKIIRKLIPLNLSQLKNSAEDTCVNKSYWMLVKKCIVSESLDKSFKKQKEMLEKTAPKYEISTDLDVLVCTLAERARANVNLLANAYVRCIPTDDSPINGKLVLQYDPEVIEAERTGEVETPSVILGGYQSKYCFNDEKTNVGILPIRRLSEDFLLEV